MNEGMNDCPSQKGKNSEDWAPVEEHSISSFPPPFLSTDWQLWNKTGDWSEFVTFTQQSTVCCCPGKTLLCHAVLCLVLPLLVFLVAAPPGLSQLIARYMVKQIVALCCHHHSFSFISFLHFHSAVITVDHCDNCGWSQLEQLASSCSCCCSWKRKKRKCKRMSAKKFSSLLCASFFKRSFTVIFNCPSMDRELMMKVRQTEKRVKPLLGSEIVKCSTAIKRDWQKTDATLLNLWFDHLIYRLTWKVVLQCKWQFRWAVYNKNVIKICFLIKTDNLLFSFADTCWFILKHFYNKTNVCYYTFIIASNN